MNRLYIPILSLLGLILMATSCSDNKSYAELLTDESHCVNAFLAQHRLVDEIPEDSVFQIGPDAPYYCLDEDHNVYMQVLDKGIDQRPEKGDRVYFRYMRYNLFNYVVGSNDNIGAGNANNMTSEATFFISGRSRVGHGLRHALSLRNFVLQACPLTRQSIKFIT